MKWPKVNPKIDDDKLLFAIGKLTVAPGDLVVLKTDLHLDKDQAQMLYERAKHFIHSNEVLILSHGIDIAILSKEGEQKP